MHCGNPLRDRTTRSVRKLTKQQSDVASVNLIFKDGCEWWKRDLCKSQINWEISLSWGLDLTVFLGILFCTWTAEEITVGVRVCGVFAMIFCILNFEYGKVYFMKLVI